MCVCVLVNAPHASAVGTFLPPPHCDGMFRLHPHRQQQLPRRAEVDVADTFGVRAAEDGQRLLRHGVPHMDGRGETCGRGQSHGH